MLEFIKEISRRIRISPWAYVLLFMTIIVSDDSFWFGTADIPLLTSIKNAYGLVLPIAVLFYYGKKPNNKNSGHFVLIAFAILLSSLFNGGISGGPILLMFTIFAAIYIATYSNRTKLFVIFVDFVFLVMLYSLVIWVGVNIGVFGISYYANSIGNNIMTCGYCTFFPDHFNIILRNGGIFREPGMFMVYICLAFLFDFIVNKRIQIYRIILYFVAILSTLSTAGVIIFAVLYFIYTISEGQTKGSRFVSIGIFVVALALFISEGELLEDIFEKIGRGEDSSSTIGRISSITIPLEILKEHPLFGIGVENYFDEYARIGTSIYHRDFGKGLSTNTILNAGGVYGFWLTLVIICGFYTFAKRLFNKKSGWFLAFVCLLMIFSNESMFYSIMVYVLVFMGFYKPSQHYNFNKKVYGK